MSTVLILLDAFRSDYLCKQNTPFLYNLSNEGEYYKTVTQSYGFCERTEILSGNPGVSSGYFTAIGYSPEHSPFSKFRLLKIFEIWENILLMAVNLLPLKLGSKIHRLFRMLVNEYCKRNGSSMPIYNIPLSFLKYFSFTEDRVDMREAPSSILELLTKSGKSYFYDSFTSLGFESLYKTDISRLDAVHLDITQNKPKDFYLIYISAPDVYGHKYGPYSIELKSQLLSMDKMLANFVQKVEQSCPGNIYFFVGDHGMLGVQKQINVERELIRFAAEFNLTLKKDFIYFLDSTMVRIWALNQKALVILNNLKSNAGQMHQDGDWVDVDLANNFKIPWPNRKYGDMLWLAKPGVLVSPDFFHKNNVCKGMHGYDPDFPGCQGMCIKWSKTIRHREFSSLNLSDTYFLLKKSLNL